MKKAWDQGFQRILPWDHTGGGGGGELSDSETVNINRYWKSSNMCMSHQFTPVPSNCVVVFFFFFGESYVQLRFPAIDPIIFQRFAAGLSSATPEKVEQQQPTKVRAKLLLSFLGLVQARTIVWPQLETCFDHGCEEEAEPSGRRVDTWLFLGLQGQTRKEFWVCNF